MSDIDDVRKKWERLSTLHLSDEQIDLIATIMMNYLVGAYPYEDAAKGLGIVLGMDVVKLAARLKPLVGVLMLASERLVKDKDSKVEWVGDVPGEGDKKKWN